MTKSKILIFSIAYFPHIGGAEVAIKEITDRISDFSWDMVTLNIDTKRNKEKRNKEIKKLRDANTTNAKLEKVGNINVYRISCSKILFPFYAYRKAKELHKLNNYQIVWGMMANLAGLGALFFTKFHKFTPRPGSGRATGHKPKFLLTLQTGNDDRKVWKKTWWWRPLYKMIYRKADYIQAISNYLAERGKRMGAVCPISLIPNGADLEKFQVPNNKLQIRSKLQISNIKPDDKVVVTTSRLVEKNGIEYLIRAMVDMYSNVKLLILGSGELENKLKSLTRELGLEEKVIFLGQVDYKDIPEHLQASDIFCRPSLSEGLGSSFIEAMACGLPIIGTRVGGIPDILHDGGDGLFCEVKSPEDINDKIKMLLNNEQLYKKLSFGAAHNVKLIYNWDKIAVDMEKIFKEF